MRKDFNWNPVFNLVMEIKDKYMENNQIDDYNIVAWCKKLNDKKFNYFINGVDVTIDNSLALFKYSMTKGEIDIYKNKDSIFREARSVVIDMDKEEIVCAPFRKFFNINELDETSIDVVKENIENAKLVEITNKLDGSMQQIRFYNGKVLLTGSRALSPKCSDNVKDGYTLITDEYVKMVSENDKYTFIFEYIAPMDAHCVNYHDTHKLFLIGVRDVYSGYQFTYHEVQEFSKKYNVPMTEFEAKNFDALAEECKKYRSDEKEGWVIRVDNNMYKMKCDEYLEIHKFLYRLTSTNVLIKAVADGYIDDLIAKIPITQRDKVKKVANVIIDFTNDYWHKAVDYYDNAPKNDDKTFAKYVKTEVPKDFQSVVFCQKNGLEWNPLKKKLNSNTPQYVKIGYITGGKHISELIDFDI